MSVLDKGARRNVYRARTRPGRSILPGAVQLVPHLQGEFDGLCGIYSAINAARVVVAPHSILNGLQSERLYKRCIERLQLQGRLEFAVTWGISQTRWHHLTDQICASVSRMVGRRVNCRRPFFTIPRASRLMVIHEIEHALRRGDAVLVALRGIYNHYTVIAGYTRTTFILFDSYGYTRIAKAACGVSYDGVRSRHQIAVRSLMLVSVAPSAQM